VYGIVEKLMSSATSLVHHLFVRENVNDILSFAFISRPKICLRQKREIGGGTEK
jgi:hypothetical protein